MCATRNFPQVDSTAEMLTDIVNRLGRAADALYPSGNEQPTEQPTTHIPPPALSFPVVVSGVRQGVARMPHDASQLWECIISSSTPQKRSKRSLARDARIVLEAGKHLLETKRPEDALRCGVWLRWVHTTNAGRESARKLIRGGLWAIRQEDHGRLLPAVQDVWNAHEHDKTIRDLAFHCLIDWLQTPLATPNPGKRFFQKGITPAYVGEVSRWVASRPGVTEASVAQVRLAVVLALEGYRESDPVQTMAVVRELLQEPQADDSMPKIAQQGVWTLPLLARVAPQMAAGVAHEDWLWSKARVPTNKALIETLGILAETAPAGVDTLARRLWNRHGSSQGLVEAHYRSAVRRIKPADVVAAYGQSPACFKLDSIAADAVWEKLSTAADAGQTSQVREVLEAVARRAEVCPRIVFDVFAEKRSGSGRIQFAPPQIRVTRLLKKLGIN